LFYKHFKKYTNSHKISAKRNLFTYGDDTTPETQDNDIVMEWHLDVLSHYANVRTDTQDVLRVVGKDYNIVQNIDLLLF